MPIVAEAISPASLSQARRRAAALLASTATRCATWYSQPPRVWRPRIVAAFLTSTRKVAWNASSTSPGSRRMPRQTDRTIRPCRATSTSKASSSRSWMKQVQEPAIGQARDDALGEQSLDLPQGGAQCFDGHDSRSSSLSLSTMNEGGTRRIRPIFSRAASRATGPLGTTLTWMSPRSRTSPEPLGSRCRGGSCPCRPSARGDP